MKGRVCFEARRLVDEAVLVSLFGFDDAEVIEDLALVRVGEETSAGLPGEGLECANAT